MWKKLTTVGLSLLVSFLMVSSVSASEKLEKEEDVSVTIKSESRDQFTLDVASVEKGKEVKIGRDAIVLNLDFDSDFIITDLRGTHEGWDLVVSAEPLKSNDNKLKRGSLSLNPLQTIEPVDGQVELPSIEMTGNSIIDDGEILVARAEENTGMGRFKLAFDENALELYLEPSDVESGVYSTTMEWKLVSKDNDRHVIKAEELEVTIDKEIFPKQSKESKDEVSTTKEGTIVSGSERIGTDKDENNGDSKTGTEDEEDNELGARGSGYTGDGVEGEGSIMPLTSTDIFNYLFIGTVVTILGVLLLVATRRKQKNKIIN